MEAKNSWRARRLIVQDLDLARLVTVSNPEGGNSCEAEPYDWVRLRRDRA